MRAITKDAVVFMAMLFVGIGIGYAVAEAALNLRTSLRPAIKVKPDLTITPSPCRRCGQAPGFTVGAAR